MRPSFCKGSLGSSAAIGLLMLAATSSPTAAQLVSLPAYNVDIKQTSVSGLSAGGFMAVQFDVAFSSILKGAGIIAGGPYYCAQGSLTTATSTCSCVPFGCFGPSSTNLSQLIAVTDQNAGRNLIDPTTNLASHRIWLFSGTSDTAVPQRVMDDLFTYYRHYIDAANIFYKNDIAAEHAMPTDFFGNSCPTRADPFINNCNYDAAGQLLQWIYGNLNPKDTGQLGGSFLNFDQSEFIDRPTDHDMAPDGWIYVPARCANGQACKLHVVFHGCKQYETNQYFSPGAGLVTFGTTYVRNTGYNKWADSNDMIMLYPQAKTGGQHPNGCWDRRGYDDANYALKSGRQMVAVRRMIDRITGGQALVPAPTDVKVTAATDTTISLSWSAVANAAGFNLYRDGVKANSSPVSATSLTDAGLSPVTNYSYVVKAIDSRGAEGVPSSPVSGTTTGMPALAAPTDVKVDTVDVSSVTLSWKAPPGVAGFDVLRATTSGGPYTTVNASPVANANFIDTGLTPSTAYFYVVKSDDGAGKLSAASAEVTATTNSAPACFTANNFEHVLAGRAHDSFFLAIANGSNQMMGPDNVFIFTTLKQTAPDFYVVDSCP